MCFVLDWPTVEDLGLISGQGIENNGFFPIACCITTRMSGAGEWCRGVKQEAKSCLMWDGILPLTHQNVNAAVIVGFTKSGLWGGQGPACGACNEKRSANAGYSSAHLSLVSSRVLCAHGCGSFLVSWS